MPQSGPLIAPGTARFHRLGPPGCVARRMPRPPACRDPHRPAYQTATSPGKPGAPIRKSRMSTNDPGPKRTSRLARRIIHHGGRAQAPLGRIPRFNHQSSIINRNAPAFQPPQSSSYRTVRQTPAVTVARLSWRRTTHRGRRVDAQDHLPSHPPDLHADRRLSFVASCERRASATCQ